VIAVTSNQLHAPQRLLRRYAPRNDIKKGDCFGTVAPRNDIKKGDCFGTVAPRNDIKKGDCFGTVVPRNDIRKGYCFVAPIRQGVPRNDVNGMSLQAPERCAAIYRDNRTRCRR